MSLAQSNRTDIEFSPEPEPQVPRTRIPLAIKLAAYTVLIVVITSLALSLAAYNPARTALKNPVRDRLWIVAEDRRDMLLAYLEQQRQLANMVFKQMFFQNLLDKHLTGTAEDFTAIGQRLRDGTQAIPASFLELSIVDPRGTIVSSSNASLVGQSIAERSEFSDALKESHFTSVAGPEVVHLYLSTPMTDESGELLGVLLCLLDLKPLTALLEGDVGLGQSGQILLATRAGENVEYLEPTSSGRARQIPLSEVPAMQLALEGKKGSLPGQYEGKAAMIVFMPVVLDAIKEGEQADWGLVAKIDAEQAYAPLTNFSRRFFLLQALLIAAGSLASYAVARRLTRPIRQLTVQATRAAGGELSVRVPTTGLDELSVLATSFNSMVERVAESREHLETASSSGRREPGPHQCRAWLKEIVIRRSARPKRLCTPASGRRCKSSWKRRTRPSSGSTKRGS